jgi:tetratricopeptide (TPR) repeat protein
MMILPFQRLLPGVCISAGLVSLLFLHAPAQGDDGTGATKAAVTTPPAVTIEPAGNLDRDIAAARQSVKENPSNASGLVRLADLLVRKGALDEAMLLFDEALKLNPRSHDAKTGRGAVLARQGNVQEAEAVLKEALLLNPNPVRTHYELGLVYEKLGDPEKALAELKEGIRKHEQGR